MPQFLATSIVRVLGTDQRVSPAGFPIARLLAAQRFEALKTTEQDLTYETGISRVSKVTRRTGISRQCNQPKNRPILMSPSVSGLAFTPLRTWIRDYPEEIDDLGGEYHHAINTSRSQNYVCFQTSAHLSDGAGVEQRWPRQQDMLDRFAGLHAASDLQTPATVLQAAVGDNGRKAELEPSSWRSVCENDGSQDLTNWCCSVTVKLTGSVNSFTVADWGRDSLTGRKLLELHELDHSAADLVAVQVHLGQLNPVPLACAHSGNVCSRRMFQG